VEGPCRTAQAKELLLPCKLEDFDISTKLWVLSVYLFLRPFLVLNLIDPYSMSYHNELPFLNACVVPNHHKPLYTSLLVNCGKNEVSTREAPNCHYLSSIPSVVELLYELAMRTDVSMFCPCNNDLPFVPA
jgi:hypothetical protein